MKTRPGFHGFMAVSGALAAWLALPIALWADGDADAQAEVAAIALVEEHHPELAALLARLKPMRPDEYRKAIRDLAQVSRSLAQVRSRDPRRYEVNLEAWKSRSRVELLTAKLASAREGAASAELEGQIRKAVERQIDAEIRQQQFERQAARERLKKIEENLERLESHRGAALETRFQAVLKKGQRARRLAQSSRSATNANKPANAKPRRASGEKSNVNVKPDSKKEPQP